MPASKPAQPAADPTAETDPAVSAENPAAADEDAVDEDVPMNRAERRAKARGGAKPQTVAKIDPSHKPGSHAQRQWANRRSG
jgi:hypothetical protein